MIQEKPEFKHTLIPAEGSQIFVWPSVGGDLVAVVVGVLDPLTVGLAVDALVVVTIYVWLLV